MKKTAFAALLLLASACASTPAPTPVTPAAPARHAITLEVNADRKTYAPGDEVELQAWIHNGTGRPIEVAKFIWDGGLTADCWFTIERDGGCITPEERSPLPQVMVRHDAGDDRFETIPSGEAATIRTIAFSRQWELGGASRALKASFRDARRTTLEPGVYRVKVRYDFHDAPAARRDCFEGTLEAETRFEVVAR